MGVEVRFRCDTPMCAVGSQPGRTDTEARQRARRVGVVVHHGWGALPGVHGGPGVPAGHGGSRATAGEARCGGHGR